MVSLPRFVLCRNHNHLRRFTRAVWDRALGWFSLLNMRRSESKDVRQDRRANLSNGFLSMPASGAVTRPHGVSLAFLLFSKELALLNVSHLQLVFLLPEHIIQLAVCRASGAQLIHTNPDCFALSRCGGHSVNDAVPCSQHEELGILDDVCQHSVFVVCLLLMLRGYFCFASWICLMSSS